MDTTYRVAVRRDPEDARFWLAEVDGLAGAHTSARSLATLDQYVRDVIVLAADLPDGAGPDLELVWTYDTGDPAADAEAEQLRRLRSELDQAAAELAARSSVLARRLVRERRFSVREAAVLLKVSPARIDQLVHDGQDVRSRPPRAEPARAPQAA